MTTRVEISCITRGNRFISHERILSIGGRNFAGKPWRMSQEGAILGIEAGKYFFYIHRAGKVINVIVAISLQGHKYLKTFADGDQPDNLLGLPECPYHQ